MTGTAERECCVRAGVCRSWNSCYFSVPSGVGNVSHLKRLQYVSIQSYKQQSYDNGKECTGVLLSFLFSRTNLFLSLGVLNT